MGISLDDQVVIEGHIEFHQDHSVWSGKFPEDLVFTVKGFLHDGGLVKLTAKGYGENHGTDDYGNGAIYIWSKYHGHLKRALRGRYGILVRSMES